jgi:hypothetical protein
MQRKDYYGILGVPREADESGVEDGTLFNFRRPLGDGEAIELLFRVKITE